MGDCYKFINLINDLIDNAIDTTSKKQLEDHIKQCNSCNLQLKNSRLLQKNLKTLPKYKTSTSFELILRSKLRNEMYKRPGLASLSWFPSLRLFPAVATLGVFFIIFGYIMVTIINNDTPAKSPQLLVSNSASSGMENVTAIVTSPTADNGSIKMKNYVNITEQLAGSHPYARELSEIQSNYGRIEQVRNDTLQRIVPSRLNKPLIRQANTIVHF